MTPKPGWQTTEFWLSIAAIVIGLVVESGVLPAGSSALGIATVISAALAALGYSWSRARVKAPPATTVTVQPLAGSVRIGGPPQAPDEVRLSSAPGPPVSER